MSMKLQVDGSLRDAYPGYRAIVLYAEGLMENQESRSNSLRLLRQAESNLRTNFDYDVASDHPHIAAWRSTFASFGVKPNRVLCGAEALMKRVLNGHDLPDVCATVNAYNAVSIGTAVPIGGENWDALTSDLTLKFSDGNEPFVFSDGGELREEYPEPGEPIWADNTGSTCRRWNWRQCNRTALHSDVTRAYFVIDVMDPYGVSQAEHCLGRLKELIRELFPASVMHSESLV